MEDKIAPNIELNWQQIYSDAIICFIASWKYVFWKEFFLNYLEHPDPNWAKILDLDTNER